MLLTFALLDRTLKRVSDIGMYLYRTVFLCSLGYLEKFPGFLKFFLGINKVLAFKSFGNVVRVSPMSQQRRRLINLRGFVKFCSQAALQKSQGDSVKNLSHICSGALDQAPPLSD